MTINQQAMGDNFVILGRYAKGKLKGDAAQALVDYFTTEIAKISDDTPVTDRQAMDAGFSIVTEIAAETGATKVEKLFIDLKKGVDDVEDSAGFAVEATDGFALISDVRNLKKSTPTADVPVAAPAEDGAAV